MNANRSQRIFIGFLLLWLATSTTLLWLATRGSRQEHAMAGMAAGLALVWVCLGGGLMLGLRAQAVRLIRRIKLPWQLTFLGTTLGLALLEEAITTGLTNLAPWFGARLGEVYITASADYLDVVLHHSVIVFLPMFAAWAWMLRRWRFTPFQVFLLFGLNGLLAETLSFGPQSLLGFAQWILVYGLMVYLPARAVPVERSAASPRWFHFSLALVLPLVCALPLVIALHLLFPAHPAIHFAPIGVTP
jgi:hypothetical protein